MYATISVKKFLNFVFDNFQLCGKCFGRRNHLKRHTDGVHKNVATQNVDANLSNDAFNVENLQVESSIELFNCVPSNSTKPHVFQDVNYENEVESNPVFQNDIQDSLPSVSSYIATYLGEESSKDHFEWLFLQILMWCVLNKMTRKVIEDLIVFKYKL